MCKAAGSEVTGLVLARAANCSSSASFLYVSRPGPGLFRLFAAFPLRCSVYCGSLRVLQGIEAMSCYEYIPGEIAHGNIKLG